ncbi:MAG: GNAT family N-acyltransferase [Pseudomonadota bacterium]
MVEFARGRYNARLAQSDADVAQALRLRGLCFRGTADPELDRDRFDADCAHVLVERVEDGAVICCFRLLQMANGREIGNSYSAQFYNLQNLESYEGSMVEMGRFCIHPDVRDPDVLRVAWGAMTQFVDGRDVDLLFGCSSFHGIDQDQHREAFVLLKEKHLAPKRWLPRVKAPSVFRFAARLRPRKPDLKAAMRAMPPLLRTYLVMGGWVSDHAVVDRDLNTLHVFTGLEVKSVPANRKRLLRAT